MSETPGQRQRPTIGSLLRRGAPPWSAAEQQAGWSRLLDTLPATGLSRPPARRRLAALALVGMAVGGFWLAVRSGRITNDGRARLGPPLVYQVEGDASGATRAATVRGLDRGGTRLRFSDGTRVGIQPGALAQVLSIHAAGARVSLLDGEILVDVVHQPGARWRFDAGPFSVFVEGTSFLLGWTRDDQRLRVQMYGGVVKVEGPLGTDTIRVKSGQTLTVRLPAHDVAIEPSPPAPEDPTAPVAPRSGGLAPASRVEPTGAVGSPPAADGERTVAVAAPVIRGSSAARAAPEHAPAAETPAPIMSWRDLIAAGRSADVVTAATSRGLGSTLARARREDLSALADAARYSRHNDVARSALRALRDRFRTSDSAHDAAFFLGLVDEADDPRSSRALEWYRRYRAEAPQGLYVADALAHEILLEERIHGRGAARASAREYLARFPHGALARDAARIASQSR